MVQVARKGKERFGTVAANSIPSVVGLVGTQSHKLVSMVNFISGMRTQHKKTGLAIRTLIKVGAMQIYHW